MNADIAPVIGLVLHFRTPEKTIACLCSQQQEGIRQVIVVDNSEDGGSSVRAMKNDLDDLRYAGLDVTVLDPGRNIGFAAGVNMGLAHVVSKQPRHVLLINSDARLAAGALEWMRHSLQAAPIIAPRIAQSEQRPISPFAYYDRLLSLITHEPKFMPLHHASGCCLLIHRDQITTPLFDEDFFFYGEDAMLGFTLQQRDILAKECGDAIIFHATSSSAKNGSMFYEYHMNRAHWLLARKLACHVPELLIFLAARCVTLPLRALVRSVRFRSLVAWKGLVVATYDVLRGRCRSFTPPA